MNALSNIVMAISLLLSFTASYAQIKNATTESVKIYGNCGMCETSIEKAGSIKKIVEVDWDKDTKMATLTYDADKTNQDAILKRVALAGYDSDYFLAPDDAYAQLPACCQYERVKKTEMVLHDATEAHAQHHHDEKVDEPTLMEQQAHPLKTFFVHYFALKDALVASDGPLASAKAEELLHTLHAVQMNQLTHEEHTVWMTVMNDLKVDTQHIKDSKDLVNQRAHFRTLSEYVYQLSKVSKQDSPTYYQYCPMTNDGKGANWLSKDSVIKNPYYGSAMLTCGKTVETID